MSILLRKVCQVTLDAAGLPELHTDVIEKTLTIVGKCGQPIVAIGGIKFATNAPKNAEMDYAVELFDAFLTANSKALLDYVAKRKTLKTTTLPAPKDFDLEQASYYNEEYPTQVKVTVKIANGFNAYINIHDDLSFRVTEALTVKQFTKIQKVLPDIMVNATAFFKANKIHKDLNEESIELGNTIAVCDI